MSDSEISQSVGLPTCRCCLGDTSYFSTSTILGFSAEYLICLKCSSVQVNNPIWIEQAHAKAISSLDTGLVSRCISASRLTATLLYLEGKKESKGLDWGGGTGLLTRLLRDQGFRVRSYDKYAKAEHAEEFESTQVQSEEPATFMTSIECFEHLVSPIDAFKTVSMKKEYFIFTTNVIATPPPDPAKASWWYYVPESGQHITFVSRKGMEEFRNILGFKHYLAFGDLHVMSRSKLRPITRIILGTRVLRGVAILLIPEILNKRFSLAVADKEEIATRKLT